MRKGVVGAIGVLGMFLSFSLVEASWPGEKEVKEVQQTEPQRESRGYRNLNIAVDILKAQNFSELSLITERILDLFSHYDVIDMETLLTATNAYLTALENIKNAGGLGFGAILENERSRSQSEEKLEPVKQRLLGIFSGSLMMSYVNGEEVFYSAGLLQRMVESGELSIDTQRTLLNMTFQVHAMSKQAVSSFLLNNIIKPLLERNETLRAEFTEKLGVDLVEMVESRRLMRERMAEAKPVETIDLVEAREGEIRESKKVEETREGKPEKAAARRRLERPRAP